MRPRKPAPVACRFRSPTAEFLERRQLLAAQVPLTGFAKTDNVYTNLNEEFPHAGTGTPGSGMGTADAAFTFDPTPSAVAAAGYAPDYVGGSNLANNGVAFTLSSDAAGHDFDEINSGQTTTVPVNLSGVATIYALMTAYNGQSFDATVTGADGTTASFADVSLPDFNGGGPINTAVDGGTALEQTVFQVDDVGGGGSGNAATGDTNNYDLTEVALSVPASLSGEVLTSVAFASHGYMTVLLAVTAVTGGTTSTSTIEPVASTAISDGQAYLLDGTAATDSDRGWDLTFLDHSDLTPGAFETNLGGSNFVPPTAATPSFTTTGGVNVSGTTTRQPYLYTDFDDAIPVTAGVAELFTMWVGTDGTTSLDVHLADGSAVYPAASLSGSTEVQFVVTSSVSQNLIITATPATGVQSGLWAVAGGNAAPTPTPTTTKTIGGLDPTFGTDGLASHDVGFTSTAGVAADGTQSVLIGPIGAAGSESFGLTRYNADGSLDTSFGTGGVVTTPFVGADAVPAAVAVLPNGDILVGGTATTEETGDAFAIAEYSASGALVPTFGTGGTTTVQFSPDGVEALHALVVAPNGTIYLGGSTAAAGPGLNELAVAALNANGSLDEGFGSGGMVATGVRSVINGEDVINGLAIQKNGELVAAGQVTLSDGDTNFPEPVPANTEIVLARFTKRGALDASFGTGGITTDAVGTLYDAAESVALQSNGEIVIGGVTATGSVTEPSSDFLVQRYTPAGRLDPTFGTGGSAVTSFGQPAAVAQVLVQPDGTIIASGHTSATLGGTLDVAVARYTTRGTLDTTFAGTGRVVVDLTAGVVASPDMAPATDFGSELGSTFDAFVGSEQGTIAVTPGGEILAAGSSGANTVEAELVTAGVDLVAKLLSAVPASVLGGLKGTATVTVTEAGTDPAKGSVTITIEFATDAAGDNATDAKTLPEKVSLKAGQGKTYKVPFTYPTAATAADYYLLATVTNGAGVPADLDANNNTAASPAPVAVAPAYVALTGSALSVVGTLTAGKAATVSIDITNGGNVTAKGKAAVDFYLTLSGVEGSSDGTFATAAKVGTASLAVGIPAGKSHPAKLKFTLPGSLLGAYTLFAVVDAARTLGGGDASAGTPVADATQVDAS